MRFSVIVVAALLASTSAALAFKGDQYIRDAKVSLDEARAAALAARPGTIADQELEREPGGSGLRYSFDIKSSGHIYEIGVDAKTGKILENSTEGSHPD